MYGVKFQTADCPANSGTLVSKDGDWHWIVKEPGGWVEATSQKANANSVPADVKTFTTEVEAYAFAKRWAKIFHPWYSKPNGMYHVVEIKAVTKTVITGYEVA